jgi:hypothetical protein
MCSIRPNVVWALDFQFDQTSEGRMLKILNVVDEFTREAGIAEADRPGLDLGRKAVLGGRLGEGLGLDYQAAVEVGEAPRNEQRVHPCSPCHPTSCRMGFDHPDDHPDDPSEFFWSRLD